MRNAGLTIAALALAFQTMAGAAQAQSVEDFRLPPASSPPAPTAAGPVDSEHPVATSTPVPSPAPVITLPSPAPPAPTAAPSPRSAPRAEPQPRAVPQPSASAAPAPAVTEAAAAVPTPEPTAILSAPTEAAAEPQAAERPALWPWFAGGAVIVLLALFLILRRGRGSEETATDEAFEQVPAPQAEPETQPEPSPPAAVTPEPDRAPPPPPPPPPQPAPSDGLLPLEIQFEPRHLSRAMVNATLAYRLTLTNRSGETFGPLRVAGDIITAHASLSPQDQLVPPNEALATIHEVPALPAGASVTLSGELRLPIASILPIHSGTSRVFVPLARFRADAGNQASAAHVFVVGQVSQQPGGALRPFALDRGPGVERDLGQRELGVPA